MNSRIKNKVEELEHDAQAFILAIRKFMEKEK